MAKTAWEDNHGQTTEHIQARYLPTNQSSKHTIAYGHQVPGSERTPGNVGRKHEPDVSLGSSLPDNRAYVHTLTCKQRNTHTHTSSTSSAIGPPSAH